jgi:hypothetical protein
MANQSEKFGLRPYKSLNGAPWNNAQLVFSMVYFTLIQPRRNQHLVTFILALLMLVILLQM